MKRFRLLLIALFLLLTCGLLFVAFVTLDTRSARELAQVKQQVHAAGLPLEPGELAQPQPSEEENAAPLYVQLDRYLNANPLREADRIVEQSSGVNMPFPQKRGQLRQALQHRQDVLQQVHKAALRPVCVFNRNYAIGAGMMQPEYARMRSGVYMLRAESALLLADGKPLEAIRNNALGFKIAQHAASDPILIADLSAISIDSITLQGLEQVLYVAGEQPGIAQAVEQSIAHNWQPHSLAYGMREQFITCTVFMGQMRRGGVAYLQGGPAFDNGIRGKMQKFSLRIPANWQKFINANEAEMLRQLMQTTQAADLPYWQAHSALQAAQAQWEAHSSDSGHLLANQLLPVYVQAEVKQTQNRAQAAVARCAASVLAWKQAHGTFPDTLKQAMPMVPVDPFDGQPLRYRREGNGFVIYSVGATGKFDGGTPMRQPDKSETVFHYPLPIYLI